MTIIQTIIKVNNNKFSYERLEYFIHRTHEDIYVLDSPKGMINHSYKPSQVLKVIFHSSPGRYKFDDINSSNYH